ncbi:sensor histidine kinase [Arenivirga flava]|uniref:Sensor-like histidine kinase SenX3 n=1 Tax=Arenivirga flava TaxID=1930060 RepID=A0AA37UUH6_9MICO|nr:ATP-binding protein [Arenivirga flava]GMA28732.1 two-component sensor histidine kinase [Arenivirga flava]
MLQWLRRVADGRASTAVARARGHFTISVAVLSIVFALVEQATVARPEFVLGIVLAAVSLLLGIPVWALRWPDRTFAPLGAIDLAAAAFINIAVYEGTGTPIGLLVAALPALWLAYWFGYPGATFGGLGGFLVTYAPAIYRDDWPTSGIGWVTLSGFPLALTIVAFVTAYATRRYRESQRSQLAAVAEASRIDSIFRAVVQQIDAWLVVFDMRGGVLVDNRALSHLGGLSGFDRSTMTAGRVYEQDRVTPIPPERQALARLLAGEEVVNEIVWAGPRGRQRAVLINGRQIETDAGALGVVVVIQDITEVQTEVLEREESLASLSHELRSPLTSIVGYSDLLEEDLGDAPQARTAAIIRRSAEHMLALTESLLSAFRDGETPKRSVVPVRETVERAIDMQRSAQAWGSRALQLEIDEALLADADPRQLLQILNNLIGNAVKYSPEDATITVRADRDGATTSVCVHNTGEPIPEEQLERIFDRFYRRPGSETGTSRGLGIGLALSRRMAAAHGGSLTASATADGTEFLLLLPDGR